MILNVVRESELQSNKKKKSSNTNDKNEQVIFKRIKELLVEDNLKYVSQNVQELLNIYIPENEECFICKKKHVIQVGEKYRVIIYIRLSQEDGDLQDGDVSTSIKNQLLYLLDEVAKRKEWVLVGIFCEEDISGANNNRPEWLKSLSFCECGNADIYLCKSQSRFTRSMEMVEKQLHENFPIWNIRFIGIVDNSDTAVEGNKKARQITGLTNQWQVEETSKQTKDTLNEMKRNGLFTGSVAPYGFLIDPDDKHHLIPDLYARSAITIMTGMLKHGRGMPLVIEVLMRKGYLTPADYKESQGINVHRGANQIREIKYVVEENETLKSIAYKYYIKEKQIIERNKLKSKKVKAGDIIIIPYRQKWTSEMIKTIVTSEEQIGTLVQSRSECIVLGGKRQRKKKEEWIRVPNCHERNMDLETFEIMQKMFQPRRKNKSQKNGELPLFSQKVYCSECGMPFYKNSTNAKNGTRKEYLQCRGHCKKYNLNCNNKESVEISYLEDYLLSQIKEKINNYFDLSKVQKEYYLQKAYLDLDFNIQQHETEKQKVQNEIDIAEKNFANSFAEKMCGNLTVEEFEMIRKVTSAKIEELKSKQVIIDKEIAKLLVDKKKQKDNIQVFEKFKDIKKLNRIVLDAFIKEIKIGKIDSHNSTRPINIEWNFC